MSKPAQNSAETLPHKPDDASRARLEASHGGALFFKGNHRGAIPHFAEAVRLCPHESAYHVSLACAIWQAGDLDRAEPHFRVALALKPQDAAIHAMLATLQIHRGSVRDALEHITVATKLRPGEISYCVTHADALWADGQYESAWEMIRPSVESAQGGHLMARTFAKMATRMGREADAVVSIERELGSATLSGFDRAQLHYAAAGLLDGLGRYDAAFEHARGANALGSGESDPESRSRFVSNLIEYYTQDKLDSLPRATHGSHRPVFIVGMPRSGTSLVEQILASHPAVFGAGELNYLCERAPALNELDHLSVERANELGRAYLERIEKIDLNAKYVTDKMPANFLYLGHAQLILPDCKVIHCVRDPRDSCLSCHFTSFAHGNEFSRDLSNLARYYRDYHRLMQHWKQTLTLPILDVRYEDVVADQARQTRRILDFLGLEWDERCLTFHENKRYVTTASREQVRRPIYSSSVGRWKHYEKFIPELMALVQ